MAGTAEEANTGWVDPSGGVWAVGGEILSEPLTSGVVVHRGSPTIESTVTEE